MNVRIQCGMQGLFTLGLIGILAGCGSTLPPKELLDAREAFTRAKSGPAAELVPAELHTAKESLDKAEQAFNDDPKSEDTRDLAYVAQRKAQLVEAQAGIAAADHNRTQAQKDAQSTQVQSAKQTQGELSQVREQLSRERQARVDAERKAKEAMDNVAKIAAIKEESRGTVITLSGSVLFASGQSTLLPAAQEKLMQVASALKEQENRTMVVEGYTDSLGKEAANQDLSQKRAQAVREFLVSQGIPPERITAVGKGSSNAIADNKTAEGRANNRRVEIVVQPGGK